MDIVKILVLLAMPGGLFAWWLWQVKRAKNTSDWPSAEATIQSGAWQTGTSRNYQTYQYPLFTISYQVGSAYFGGSFALSSYITDPGPSVIDRMIGTKLQVRYDPAHPEVWFIPDELLEGCRVHQDLGHVHCLCSVDGMLCTNCVAQRLS